MSQLSDRFIARTLQSAGQRMLASQREAILTAEGKKQNRRVEVYMYASEEMVKEAEAGTLN